MFNGLEFCYIYIFQVDRHSINVLRESKYPPNAIFHNAKYKRANVTGSMNRHNNVEPPKKNSHPLVIYIYIYMFQAVRHAVNI